MAWSKLKTRLVSAAILVVVLLIVTFAPEWVFTLAVSAACFVVLHEIMVTFKQETKLSIVIIDYIFAGLYMLSGFLRMDTGNQVIYMITIFFVLTLLIFSVVDHREINFNDVCASL
ncbi:MAG: phosphatidate cytidylyltransferase, partial [Eubacteriales bacterium]